MNWVELLVYCSVVWKEIKLVVLMVEQKGNQMVGKSVVDWVG